MSLADVSLVELTVWAHERCEQPGGFAEALRDEIGALGGEAPPEEVRAWLKKRLAEREQSGRRYQTREAGFARTAPCGCGDRTDQLTHGYTATGGLWKGHACACRGWQCNDCGRINERRGECCR